MDSQRLPLAEELKQRRRLPLCEDDLPAFDKHMLGRIFEAFMDAEENVTSVLIPGGKVWGGRLVRYLKQLHYSVHTVEDGHLVSIDNNDGSFKSFEVEPDSDGVITLPANFEPGSVVIVMPDETIRRLDSNFVISPLNTFEFKCKRVFGLYYEE